MSRALGSMPSSEGAVALHRPFMRVPDYGGAACWFLGDVAPLSSMQGLPSYNEASSLPSTPYGPTIYCWASLCIKNWHRCNHRETLFRPYVSFITIGYCWCSLTHCYLLNPYVNIDFVRSSFQDRSPRSLSLAPP